MESNNITKILNELGSGPVAEANFGFRKWDGVQITEVAGWWLWEIRWFQCKMYCLQLWNSVWVGKCWHTLPITWHWWKFFCSRGNI